MINNKMLLDIIIKKIAFLKSTNNEIKKIYK